MTNERKREVWEFYFKDCLKWNTNIRKGHLSMVVPKDDADPRAIDYHNQLLREMSEKGRMSDANFIEVREKFSERYPESPFILISCKITDFDSEGFPIFEVV